MHNQELALCSAQVGDRINGSGFFMGNWISPALNGNPVGIVWAIIASPTDLMVSGKRLQMSFEQACEEVGERNALHQYHYESFPNEESLSLALSLGTYRGGELIPQSFFMYGKGQGSKENIGQSVIGKKYKPMREFGKNTEFKATFASDLYLTSTPVVSMGDPSNTVCVPFPSGDPQYTFPGEPKKTGYVRTIRFVRSCLGS